MAHSTVLVIDDDPEIPKMLEFILARRGVEVLAAASGAEACLTALLADVVLCDLGLGRESGVEVALALRERQVTVPIVLMSGLATTGDPEELAPADLFAAVLRKPFLVDDLCTVLAQCGVDCRPRRQGVWTARQLESMRGGFPGAADAG